MINLSIEKSIDKFTVVDSSQFATHIYARNKF